MTTIDLALLATVTGGARRKGCPKHADPLFAPRRCFKLGPIDGDWQVGTDN